MSNTTVTFTPAQVEAVSKALAYYTAGSPDDVATSKRVFRSARRAHDKLLQASKPKAKPGRYDGPPKPNPSWIDLFGVDPNF